MKGLAATRLAGQQVVICRSARDAKPLIERLQSFGATVVSVPLVEPVAAADGGEALRTALTDLGRFEWLLTTSANGSRATLEALNDLSAFEEAASGEGPLGKTKVACVGSATAQVFIDKGIPVALQASVSSAAGLVTQFDQARGLTPPKVLAALGEMAADEVVTGLRSKGYEVHRVDAYDTVAAQFDEEVQRRVERSSAVLFTSSSTVERFLAAFGKEHVPALSVSIGPTTSATMKRLEITPAAEATRYTQEGVIEALLSVISTMGR